MKKLLEDYQNKLKSLEQLINQTKYGDNKNLIRLVEKRSCYKQFIYEIEYEIKYNSHQENN